MHYPDDDLDTEDDTLEEDSSPTELEVVGDSCTPHNRVEIVTYVEDSNDPIEVIVERVLEFVAAEYAAAPDLSADEHDYSDDLIGAPPARSLDTDLASLRTRLATAISCPWAVRPSHAREKLPRWQRLRLLEALGCLRHCWVREAAEEARRCTISDKRHKGCSRRGLYGPTACQQGQLLHLSQEIGGLAFYAQFRPQLDASGRAVAPPEWPSGASPHARKMTNALWAHFRDRTHTKSDVLRGHVSNMKGGASEARAPCSLTDRAAAVNAPTAGEQTPQCAHDAPPIAYRHGATLRFAPFHVTDTPSYNAESDVRPHTITVELSESLVKRRAELTDHGLYVCHLLTRPDLDKPRGARERQEQAEGWRALTAKYLQRDLGQVRVDGKRVERAALLLGSRESPGLLERLGIIERRSDYSAGGKGGYSQRYRLRPGVADGPVVEVDLVLRERSKGLPRPAKPSGPPVHPWLLESYRCLTLDTEAVLRELCATWGCFPRSTAAEVLADLETKLGAPQELRDIRAKLSMIERWAGAASARHHKLKRDATVWRLHSPLTELPSAARRHLRLDGEPVATLDIRACGLALRAAQMRATGADADPDVAAVCDLIEDPTRDPYVEFFHLTHARAPTTAERDVFKHDLLAELWFADVEGQLRSSIGKAVRTRYPGFHSYLLRVKREIGHVELANSTMRLESTLVLDKLAAAFAEANVCLATVHDCIYVRASEADRARELFEAVLRDTGVRAVLNVTRPDVG